MRRSLLAALAAVLVAPAAGAADPPKDTLAAAFTRTRKLRGKVTLDLKAVPLAEALRDLSAGLEDAKLGALVAQFAPGVPSDVNVTYSATGVPAEDALDGLLRPHGLGYVVVSKPGDRADGWVTITRGAERGYPPGVGPKPPAVPPADPEDERLARAQLDVAKSLLADGKADRARTVLTFVAKKYPATKAAAEAKTLLGKTDK